MPKYRSHLSTFKFGEVSPKFDGRTDLESYRKSCKQLKNFLVTPSGVTKRYGTKHVASERLDTGLSYSAFKDNSLLIPYSYSNGEEYIIIISTLEINFCAYEISTGRMFEVSSNAGGTLPGFTNVGGMTFDFYGANFDASKVQYSQRGDLLYIVHPEYPPYIILREPPVTPSAAGFGRFGIYAWCASPGFSDAATWETLPYQDLNTTTTTLTASATTGTAITLTANASLFATKDHLDRGLGSKGSIYAILDSGVVGYCTIEAVVSDTVATARVLTALPAAAATSGVSTWYESSWSTRRGWPRTVTHVNGRVVYGGTYHQPDTFWESQENDFFQMITSEVDHLDTQPLANTDAFSGTLMSGQISDINWISGNKGRLAFGTSDKEYTMIGPDNTKAMGADNFSINEETSYGSEPVQVQGVGSSPIFVQRGYKKLRDMFFNRDSGGYLSNDISVLGEHFIRKSADIFSSASVARIKQVIFQKANDEILWVIDTNGYLWGITKSESNGITAFHDHSLGGFSNSAGDEPPKVLSIAVNKSPFSYSDELYLLVERYIDGSAKIYFEKLTHEFEGSTLVETSPDIDEHPVFMDSSLLLRKQEPTFFASYDTSFDADTSDGSGTGTATGSPATPAGDLDLGGGTVKYVSYDGTGNVDTAQVGCIRFLFKPDFAYYGLAAAFKLFAISKANGDADNLIQLEIDQRPTNEEFRLTINDSAGSPIINDVQLVPDIGFTNSMLGSGIGKDHWVEVELNYDLTNGVTQLFVGGAQVGDTITSTGTRDTSIDLLRIGSDYTGADAADGFFKDFQFYDTVQHTSNYKPTIYWDGTTSVKGLELLEGQSVRALRDGNAEAARTVTSGAITLDEAGDFVLIGLPYTSVLETMEIEDGSAIGSSQGAIKRVDKVFPRFFKSASCSMGSDVGNVDAINFRDSSESISDPIVLKTGIREPDYGFDMDLDHNRQATVYLESDDPLPCTLASLTIRGVTGD